MSTMIRKRRKFLYQFNGLILATALSALTGCAGTAKPLASPNPEPGHGIVLVHISTSGIKYLNRFAAVAREIGREKTVDFTGWDLSSEGYWAKYYDETEKGRLVALQLPAGSYEFHSFIVNASGWGGTRSANASKAFSYPFNVSAGKASYLGELHFSFKGDTGVVSVQGQQKIPLKIVVRDRRHQDLPEAIKQIPGLTIEQIAIQLLQ